MLKVLSKAKVYFHATIGEHFGIPVIEAMASGVIPIVPKESGAYEVVPEFSYSDIEEAVTLLKSLLENENIGLRREMKNRALNFSKENFKRNILSEISSIIF